MKFSVGDEVIYVGKELYDIDPDLKYVVLKIHRITNKIIRLHKVDGGRFPNGSKYWYVVEREIEPALVRDRIIRRVINLDYGIPNSKATTK